MNSKTIHISGHNDEGLNSELVYLLCFCIVLQLLSALYIGYMVYYRKKNFSKYYLKSRDPHAFKSKLQNEINLYKNKKLIEQNKQKCLKIDFET